MIELLVVEDDTEIAASLRSFLEREGYRVKVATNLAEARAVLGSPSARLDAMLLDWRLPDGEGIDLLKELRKTSELPVIMVTARVEVIDRVVGLEIGADDYVTKPVEPRELVARLRARIRGKQKSAPPKRVIEYAGIRIDLDDRSVLFAGAPVPTTRMEFDLLALLLEHPGRVFSREELLNRVWGYERTPTTRTVDTHVVQLRNKLRAEVIESVRGVGYRMPKQVEAGRNLT